MTRHELVAAYVTRTRPDAAELLEMLGVTVDGALQPDDERDYEIGRTLMQVREASKIERPIEMTKRPKLSTAPEGLRNMAPVVVEPRPVGRLPLADCPSKPARKRHRRNNQSCAVCGVEQVAA